jgi:signal transduction histidine kinase
MRLRLFLLAGMPPARLSYHRSMRPTDYLPRWRVSGDSGTVPIGPVPIGPAMTTLRSVIARLASVVRSAGILYIAVQVAIWHSFYTADSWRLAGPVVTMLWAAPLAAYLWQRSPAPFFACMDSVVCVALAVSAQWCVPPAIRGYAFSWLAIAMSCQLIVPAWYAPAALSAPLALVSPVAYWVGADQVARTGTRMATATTILLILVAGIHLYGRRELYGRAAAADAALDQADRDAGEQYVILSRTIERREHERLLHDTILNTLTALTRAGTDDAAEVVSRCRQDVALIEEALSAPGHPDAGGAPRRPQGDLVGGVRSVAAEMRSRGLHVHVQVTGDGPQDVPATVASAISNATREALSNVAEHAETGEAWVEVSLTGSAAPGRLGVTVRDRGRGFDLARVDPTRLGLRRSIAERVADCGGRASIWSAPGQGTVVRMSWPEPAAPAEPAEESLPW